MEIGRQGRHVPVEAGGHEAIVVGRDGAVAELGEVGLGLDDGLSEGAANVAVSEGWRFKATVVEEEVCLRAGNTKEVFEPWLVGPGVG